MAVCSIITTTYLLCICATIFRHLATHTPSISVSLTIVININCSHTITISLLHPSSPNSSFLPFLLTTPVITAVCDAVPFQPYWSVFYTTILPTLLSHLMKCRHTCHIMYKHVDIRPHLLYASLYSLLISSTPIPAIWYCVTTLLLLCSHMMYSCYMYR